MKTFTWHDILSFLNTGTADPFFNQGTGISVGSFDGLHSGHRLLLSMLVDSCQERGLLPGVITFKRPLPSIKHSGDYLGDISTLNQRLRLFEEIGIQFAVIVDFDDEFSSMLGTDFLNILVNACNMNFIAEGVDFKCGYKGATDVQAIKYFAQKNAIETVFLDPVYFMEGTDMEERVSSSYIRSMILKGFFTTCNDLIKRCYTIELPEQAYVPGENAVLRSKITQVIPPAGVYHCISSDDVQIRVEITDEKILLSQKTSEISFK